jgi:uncharacterized protein YbjT (DUF2867 family)
MKQNDLVLVLGASGGVGVQLVKALRAHGFQVRAFVRDPAKAGALAGEGVEVVTGDVTSADDIRRALAGCGAVASALGSRAMSNPELAELIEHKAIAQLADLARQSGVRQIVLCSSMGTETPELIPPLTSILRAKRRGEQAVEASGVPYTIVRPGGLVDEPGGQDVLAARTIRGFGRIPRADVAEVMVQALLQPEAQNKIVEIIAQPDAGKADRSGLFV